MTAALLAAALLTDAALGEPRWLWSRLPHPAVLMGRLIGWMDRRFNTGEARRAKGVGCVAALVIGTGALGHALAQAGPVAEVIVAAILLAQRSLVDHVRDVATGLQQGLGEGRAMVARIVSRDTAAMAPPDVARAAIESASENLSDGVIAPAFWFLVAGLPGILIYKAVNTADSMIGYRTPRHAAFGWAAARLDDVLNLIPARLTALLIWAVGGAKGDWRAIIADASRHKSPNAGWPEAAMARALGIALAGPRVYDGERRDYPFVNAPGRRDAGADDILRAVTILWRAWAAALAGALLIALA